MRKLRPSTVFHISNSLSPLYGGPVSVVLSLAIEQSRIGYRPIIISTYSNKSELFSYRETLYDLKVHGVKFLLFPSFGPYRISLSLLLYLYKFKEYINVIHLHGLYRFPLAFIPLLARIKNIPYVIQLHGSLNPYFNHHSHYGFIGLIFKKL